nr:toxin [Schaalia sp. 19OD2882]
MSESQGRSRRPRRRAVHVSEVDQRLLDKGLPPSWEEGPSPLDEGGEASPVEGVGNDARLVAEVPPHWHAHL